MPRRYKITTITTGTIQHHPIYLFTRPVMNVYIDGMQVASHARSHEYGYTYVKEHLASNCRAVMERSASYYTAWAARISPDCRNYIAEVFNPQRTNQPAEVYYKLRAAVMSLSRKYELEVLNLTCRQCLECKVFSYNRFEAILKRNSLKASADEPGFRFDAPVPTGHANMRGSDYFK